MEKRKYKTKIKTLKEPPGYKKLPKNGVIVGKYKGQRFFLAYRNGERISRRKVAQKDKSKRITLDRAKEIFKGGYKQDGRVMEGGTLFEGKQRKDYLLEGGKTREISSANLTDIRNPTPAPRPSTTRATKVQYICEGYYEGTYISRRSHFLGSVFCPTKAECVKDARSKFWKGVHATSENLGDGVDSDEKEGMNYISKIQGYSEGWVYYVKNKSTRTY